MWPLLQLYLKCFTSRSASCPRAGCPSAGESRGWLSRSPSPPPGKTRVRSTGPGEDPRGLLHLCLLPRILPFLSGSAIQKAPRRLQAEGRAFCAPSWLGCTGPLGWFAVHTAGQMPPKPSAWRGREREGRGGPSEQGAGVSLIPGPSPAFWEKDFYCFFSSSLLF